MATRNRTAQFLQFREQHRAYRSNGDGVEEKSKLLGHSSKSSGGYQQLRMTDDDDAVSPLSESGPPWKVYATSVEVVLNKARTKVGDLRKAHAKRLLPSFDVSNEEQLEHEIGLMSKEITELFRDADANIRRIEVQPRFEQMQSVGGVAGLRRAAVSREEQVLCRNVQAKLATEVHELTTQFKKDQNDYIQRLKAQVTTVRTGVLVPGLGEIDEGNLRIDDDDDDHPNMNEQSRAAMLMAREQERRVRERAIEIQKITHSVNELAQLMTDMSKLVIDQGTMLDRIDHNVDMTVNYVQSGNEQLVKAEASQKNNRYITCVGVMGAVIILLFLMLIIKHSHSRRS